MKARAQITLCLAYTKRSQAFGTNSQHDIRPTIVLCLFDIINIWIMYHHLYQPNESDRESECHSVVV